MTLHVVLGCRQSNRSNKTTPIQQPNDSKCWPDSEPNLNLNYGIVNSQLMFIGWSKQYWLPKNQC